MDRIPIIYENSEIYIINKRAGMPVQGGEKISHPLDEELAKQTGQKVYLVHRLDKDTSGLEITNYSTVDIKRGTTKMWLIGNTISQVCPYLEDWGLQHIILNQKQGTINEE